MFSLKANKGCLVGLFCLFHLYIFTQMPNPYTDREQRSLDGTIILKRNQTNVFINLIYVLFSPEACYN